MRIRGAEIFLIRIPLRMAVKHAAAERRETTNVVVRLIDENGTDGWGEGVPRSYVTGETPEGTFEILVEKIIPLYVGREIETPEDVFPFLHQLGPPAAGSQTGRCAAELALFDLTGKVFKRSAADWFGGPRQPKLRYSGVLPLMEEAHLIPFLEQLKQLNPPQVKIKANGGGWLKSLAEARRILGDQIAISVDANGAWNLPTAVRQFQDMERYQVSWVEQPLPRGTEEAIPTLAAKTSIPIMVDESLTTITEAREIIDRGGCRLFNLRLSKLGGLTTSHQIGKMAREKGLEVQVGCQVGETAILSAAGRLLAATLPRVEAVEGSFGTRILGVDLSTQPFQFGSRAEAAVQEGFGLGITIDEEVLRTLAVETCFLK